MKCFMSFSAGSSSASRVAEKLRELKVTILDPFDLSPGKAISESSKAKLIAADFAIFVLSDISFYILYEIGLCDGIGKPFLLVADEKVQLPSSLENSIYIRVADDERDMLNLTLETFVRDQTKLIGKQPDVQRKQAPGYYLERNSDGAISGPSKKALGLELLLERLPELRASGNGKEIEKAAEDLFKLLTLKYATNDSNTDTGADFALWNDKLGRVLGNPIIVEIKGGRLSRQRINQAQNQLRVYADKANAKIAILIYLDKEARRYDVQQTLFPLILTFDLEDLARELLTSSFEKLILNHRNRIAHGSK